MNRDKLLLAEDKNFLKKMVDKIFKRKPRDFKIELIKAIDKTAKEFKSAGKEKEVVNILRKRTGIKINSLTDLKKHINLIESDEPAEGEPLNEGAFTEWWAEAKGNAYNALAFYPMLTMFLEFDKVLKGLPDASLRTTVIYLLIWVLVITGKIEHKQIIQRAKNKGWQNLSGNPYGGEVSA